METIPLDPLNQNPPSSPVECGSVPTHTEHTSTCRECQRTIRYRRPVGIAGGFVRHFAPTICDTCLPILEAREAERQVVQKAEEDRRRREQLWEEICPPLYRATTEEILPPEAGRALQSAKAWQYGPRGLGFAGPTRRGKTRVAMLILDRMLRQEGRRIAYVNAVDFGHQVSRLSGESLERFDKYLRGLCGVDVLFIDDLGKERATDRVTSELYHVVEQRAIHLRPVLFTMNAGSRDLEGKLDEDRGPAIVSRLKDFCEVIVV